MSNDSIALLVTATPPYFLKYPNKILKSHMLTLGVSSRGLATRAFETT